MKQTTILAFVFCLIFITGCSTIPNPATLPEAENGSIKIRVSCTQTASWCYPAETCDWSGVSLFNAKEGERFGAVNKSGGLCLCNENYFKVNKIINNSQIEIEFDSKAIGPVKSHSQESPVIISDEDSCFFLTQLYDAGATFCVKIVE